MNLHTDGLSDKPRLHSQNYFLRKRKLKELLHVEGDDSGYIEGKVFMIWPPRNRLHRLNLEVLEDSVLYRFELEIPHSDGFTFRPHEHICLALKGVRVDRRKESSAPHYFPMVLRFPDGVVLKYLSGVNAGKVVDTWMKPAGNTDEWYNPGITHTVSEAVAIDVSGIHHGPVSTVTYPPMPTTSRRDVTNRHDAGVEVGLSPPPLITGRDGAAIARSARQVPQPNSKRAGRLLNGRPRKKRRMQKGKESTPPIQPSQPPIDVSSISDGHARIHQPTVHTHGEIPIQKDSTTDLLRESSNSNTVIVSGVASSPARLNAGIHTQRGDIFTALNDLQKGHAMINIIGVVTSVTPERKTATNEWTRSFTLVDPSTVDLPRQGITVNCFQKEHLEWLPQVQKDAIVILRRLKVVKFNGIVTATGYGDKLRWAVYDPHEHSIQPPNKGNAPEKELIDDGLGYEFSPYWEPSQDSTELEYCQKIGEWWRANCQLKGEIISTVECSGRPRKQHLLVSEASPDLPPNGFFNCTVEVLQKFDNSGGATTVYVTDYTTNALVHSVQAPWCPPELSNWVLQCNMWDDAKNIAMIMNPGEYWYLHNVRARWNPGHFMEATMQLAEKVTQLDETKLEVQPHLRALLTRKREFEMNKSSPTSGSPSSHTFPELLLQDVDGSTCFLTCIVELLHVDLNSRDGHFIYVTDFTFNPDLPPTVSANWAHNLEHRVLKIKLDDTQAKISLDLRPGSTYIIHNLRIKHLDARGDVHGYLGGESTLIISLHDLSSHHAQTLQRSKEKWKRESMLNALRVMPNESHEETNGLLSQPSVILNGIFLHEIPARPAPDMFRVLARTVDFFPFSLEDACVLRCTKCESSPPPSFKRCPRCDDMMETHCKWFYCLYVLLQDEKGGELIVSLSGKECTLLQDVDPTDFRCDQVAFRRFLTKLDHILGNLRDVHVAWSKNEHKIIQSPLMVFTLESWKADNEKGYSLVECTSTL